LVVQPTVEAGDVAIAAQATDLVGGEALPGGRFAALTIQDSSDHFIGIENARRRSSEIVSSSVRGPMGLNRGTGTSSVVMAPPRQRKVRWA